MEIRHGHAWCFVFGIAVGAALTSVLAPWRESLSRTTVTNASRAAAAPRSSPQSMEKTLTKSEFRSSFHGESEPFAALASELVSGQVEPRDVRLELWRTVGSLLGQSSASVVGLSASDEEAFLAAWEKFAAAEPLGGGTRACEGSGGSMPAPLGKSDGNLLPSSSPATRE